MKKIKIKLNKWFFNRFLKRHFATIDSKFLDLFTKQLKHTTVSFGNNQADKQQRIINVLSSKKYKKFFYTVVNREINDPLPSTIIKPYGNGIWDRISNFISIQYLRFFDKKQYKAILLFKKWKHKLSIMDGQIDKYMNDTSLLERSDRRLQYGIIDENRNEAINRLLNIKSKNISKIIVNNQK